MHGHVGNGAAVLPMQALGIEVVAVPTTLLSNHPLYPTTRGRILDAALVADLLRGVEERGLVEASQAILTGYLGSPETGAAVADFIVRAKARNPSLVCVCDPVIGDEGRLFVAEGLIQVFRDSLVPAASVVTPNQFELETLAGRPVRTMETLRTAADALMLRAQRVVVTGCALDDAPADVIETIVCGTGSPHRIAAKRLPIRPNGAGDLFAALLAAHLVLGASLFAAAEAAVAGVSAVLQKTLADGAYELSISPSDFAGLAPKIPPL